MVENIILNIRTILYGERKHKKCVLDIHVVIQQIIVCAVCVGVLTIDLNLVMDKVMHGVGKSFKLVDILCTRL